MTDWERVQVKTFQNWVNSQLARREMKLNNLITGLHDGVFLSELLEIISGKVIPHKKAGSDLDLRHKKIDNLSNAMKFVSEIYKEAGFKVETSAEDIADCRTMPILGMIWVIILKFAVSSFHDMPRAAASTGTRPSKLSTKDALLVWAQRNTAGHAGVNIQNFSMSWRDGLALCALVHFLDPTLLHFSSLKAEDAAHNIELALTISEQRLGVARLFDPSDCLEISRPDEKSIMTYLASWWQKFSGLSRKIFNSHIVQKAIQEAMALSAMRASYYQQAEDFELFASKWVKLLSEPNNASSFRDLQAAFMQFDDFESSDFLSYDALLMQAWLTP